MSENLNLFAPVESRFKLELAAKLATLARHGLFLGTSSWKYEGWLGSIYSRERYASRGRFSKVRFERECLSEYSEVFPIVSGDFAFYGFPSPGFWPALFSEAAPPFRFAFKAPEDITAAVFPRHPRYGRRSGETNPLFLDAELLRSQFLDCLAPFADRVAVIIFEFPAGNLSAIASPESFQERFALFFQRLPSSFRYAVELRNPELLTPSYCKTLRSVGVAHTFNSWTAMPGISEQMANPDAFTAPFTVARALTVPGRTYEQTVALFSPYEQVQQPNPAVRNALRDLLVRSKARAEESFLFINNRLEGFSPGTINAVADSVLPFLRS